ncbi:hypothetical protein [Streptomyces sp. NPDC046870]|uniref:hypothetical protein n=1 Tax=Streptomyces sp. NPDC046870 TaxID=3155135 RepID=UPI0034550E09
MADMPPVRRRVRAFLADRGVRNDVLDDALLVVFALLNAFLEARLPHRDRPAVRPA